MHMVLPKYRGKIDFDVVKDNHDLPEVPKLIFLHNFGIQKSGIVAFTLFNIPAILFLLQKKINGEVDFLYFRTSYFIPTAILARILRIPLFYETHRRPISRSEKFRDHLMSTLATGIIVISSYMREHYLSYKEEILVAHDAVSLKRFASTVNREEARKSLGLAPDEKICVYAGTVNKLKGIEYVIVAARILPEVHFLLVGSVSPEFAITNLPVNVKLLGRVGQKDLPQILRAADVLLLPHPRGEYSQSPMKLFEYMASGIPIVASRLPSISEVLNDENAVLVEAESGEALANGIGMVLGDAHHSQAIARKAYNDVQNYTWEKRGIAIAEFIRKTTSYTIK
ncbi:MAG: hypothetical protein A3C70_03295 [Candidatus Zambryskibacteria bacterium RIFCSPHIGHO2_02_FULL_43_14]|uniref:Glycosyl transferase family 1 domain-containing protein n=1 Tax=Candidatus Zambryskibacteria bacterium RIFCSPHIGHO2_02_FULL_43_14 TaxID=1802748 RepID=A0A1G2TEJ3_9BACT|nr:MAG: hypothetical protein A3C70_03295 [Candidatus Zambryskibacteria bacterium RIFCSPHIGHO2_02_FULL_43_14]